MSCLAVMLGALGVVQAQPDRGRKLFTNSVRPMRPAVGATARALRPEHLRNELEFEVPLQMRNYPKLLERIGRGEEITRPELERDYLPVASDYDAVVKWLQAEGFAVTQTTGHRLSVFARGTVAQIQQSFQVQMMDVTVDGEQFSSAVTHPSLPAAIAQPVLGINGLQPYLRVQKHSLRRQSTANALDPVRNTANAPPYLVKEVLGAYDATNLGVTGAGQKIAILIDTAPANADLTNFWSHNSIAQSLSNIEEVNVTGATLPAASGEETLDVEWSSGIAPGAKIRVYATATLAFTNIDKALQRIIDDLPSQPELRVLSISLGLGETYLSGSSEMQTESQYFATLAASGVTVCVSSGDEGSNPDTTNDGNATGPTQVEYEASDPSVTGVGGTSLTLNSATGAVTNETAWSGSGGGTSNYFSRPAWQTGPGVPTGTKRLVPDVALVASDTTAAYFYFQGKADGVAGTSWSAPTWAGFCALINEARAKASLPTLGLLNPTIYPLIGTANFRDITTGNNGNFSAGVGYDRVTGIGVPDLAVLLGTLTGSSSGTPSITSFNPASGAVATSVTIIGTNLSGTTAVKFNGVSASYTVNSATQVSATVPGGATSGPLSVETPAGTATSSSSFTVTAGAPANDSFAAAQTISGTSGATNGSNAGASKEAGEPSHAGNPAATSVWYAWTAPAGGTYTFDTFGSSFDTVLAIYLGSSVEALTQIAANDDYTTGVTSSVSFAATAGVTYRIAVDGYGGATGSVVLDWALNAAAPTINNFVPDTGSPGASVVINGANFIGAAAVAFNGTNASFTVISGTQITAIVPSTATTGVVTVTMPGGAMATSAGVFVVNSVPANDNFAAASVLTGAAGTIAGRNANATKETGEPDHAGNAGGHSVWYSWTAPADGPCNFSTSGSSFDTELAIYTGTSVGGLSLVGANEDSGSSTTSSVSFNALSGTVYRIAVDGYGGATGNITLSWSTYLQTPQISGFTPTSGSVGTVVTISGLYFTGTTSVAFNGTQAGFTVISDTQLTATVPLGATSGEISVTNLVGTGTSTTSFTVSSAPPNDQFASAAVINGTSAVTGSNVGGSKEVGEPNHAGNAGGHSVWWTWTAPNTSTYVISTRGSSFDTLLAVYSGSTVSGLTQVAANDDDAAGGVTSSLMLNATSGTIYQIAVDGFNGASGNIVVSILDAGGGSTSLFTTAFEAAENYSTASNLVGQNSWVSSGSGGNGLVNGFIGGQGQQAYIGFGAPNAGESSLEVWRAVNFSPGPNDNVTFSVLMSVKDSTNGHYDHFQWAAYNMAGNTLFALDFDNSLVALPISYSLDDGSGLHRTGFSFRDGQVYTLQVTIDFAHNRWTANLGASTLVMNQPITTTGAPLNLGAIHAGWKLSSAAAPGNNYLLFDNFAVSKVPSMAPQIVLPPQSQAATVGDTVTLSVVANGSAPLSYQWREDNSDISGATASSLVLSNVALSTAGSYSVVVTNTAGSLQSDPAVLTVNPQPNLVDLVPYQPSGWSAAVVVSRSATGTTDSASLQSTDSLYVSWSALNNSTQATPKPFHCAIYVDDVLRNTWNASALPGGYFTYVRGYPVGSLGNGVHSVRLRLDSDKEVAEVDETNNEFVKNITVGSGASYQVTASALPSNGGQISGSGSYQGGTTATLVAAPASGYTFGNWTEGGTVVSLNATYQFTVSAARTLAANFTPDTTPPSVAITFPTVGAIFDTSTATLDLAGNASDNVGVTSVTWSNDRGGSGSAKGTASWSITGMTLQPGANHLAVTAHDAAGGTGSANLTVNYSPAVDFSGLAGSYGGLLQTNETIPRYVGMLNLTLNPRGVFTGTVRFEGVSSALRGRFAADGRDELFVLRAGHASVEVALRVEASLNGTLRGTVTDGTLATTLTAHRSIYNVRSNPCPLAGKYTLLLPQNGNDSSAPRGDGGGRVVVSLGGNVIFTGWLADGSVLSQSARLYGNAAWPFYHALYARQGYVAGAETFENISTSQVDGPLDWFKPQGSSDHRFPDQFQTRLATHGSTYVALSAPSPTIALGNRALTLDQGALLSPINRTVAWVPPNSLAVQDAGAEKLKIQVIRGTGLLNGSFLHPGTGRTSTLHAALLQPLDTASGFFLTPTEAGSLEIGAAR